MPGELLMLLLGASLDEFRPVTLYRYGGQLAAANRRIEMNIKTILNQIAAIQKDISVLTDWERDFVKSISERAEKYGEGLNVSDKQAGILSKIFEERVGASRNSSGTKSA